MGHLCLSFTLPTQIYIKHFEEKYQEKWENAYLTVKNARASRALRWAMDPGFTHPPCYVAKIPEKFSGPPLHRILDPLLVGKKVDPLVRVFPLFHFKMGITI